MTFDWHQEYARALDLFGGDTPSAHLEQEILNAFKEHPQAVTNAITKIGKAYANGKINSPWGALKAEIPKQVDRDIRVGDGHERRNAIACAEVWISRAGVMFDRWTEVEDELFGDHGKLHPWRRDAKLVADMQTLWDEARPVGVLIEAAELERATRYKETHQRIRSTVAPDSRALALAMSHTPLPTDTEEPLT